MCICSQVFLCIRTYSQYTCSSTLLDLRLHTLWPGAPTLQEFACSLGETAIYGINEIYMCVCTIYYRRARGESFVDVVNVMIH